MLTPVDIEATSSSSSSGATSSSIQIGAQSGSANAIIYTVPSGKKFVGWASSEYSYETNPNYAPRLVVGSISIVHFSSFSATPTSSQRSVMAAPEITLLAGTTVKVGPSGNSTYVFGVESNA